MIKNYIVIAFRNLVKQKVFTLINALGLSLGIGSCLFIIAIVQYEYSFDTYHENLENIYRLTDEIVVSEESISHVASTPIPWAPAMHKDYPEIKNFVRFLFRGHTIKHNNNFFRENICYTDPDVFDIFTYEILKGDPKTALVQPNSIVISTEIAEKYFGKDDPMGKFLTVDNNGEFKITGVFVRKDNSSFNRQRILASFSSLTESNFEPLTDWRSHWLQSFFLLEEGVSPEALESRFPEFINTYIEEQYRGRYRPRLQPLKDIHLSRGHYSSEPAETLDDLYIYIFVIIGFFVLVIACINFMNMSTAKSSGRAREVGIRKALGAFRKQLIAQFIAETVVISVIALVIALIFVELAIPWYVGLTQREIDIKYTENLFYLFSIVGVTAFVGFLAGSYPAFFLSSFKPANVLKSSPHKKISKSVMRKILVTGQFTIAVFMIIANILLFQQINYFKNKDLGFEKDNLVIFIAPSNNTSLQQEAIISELEQYKGIRNITLTSNTPGDGFNYGRFIPEGKEIPEGMMLPHIAVDYNFFETLKIDILNGRNFSNDIITDVNESVIINETAAKQFGWADPVGKNIRWINAEFGLQSRTVIGVIRDYHFETLQNPIRPLILHLTREYFGLYLIRVQPENITVATEYIAQKWREYDPEMPVRYFFLDQDLADEYDFEEIIGSLLIKFTFLTIFIACLGLLGMASFTALQRTREIGIRKVLGATVPGVIYLLTKEFLKYVAIANFIAWPAAYFAMNLYLQEFAYRIDIGFLIFLLAGIISLVLAGVTVSFQALKAASINPVVSLRQE